MINNKKLEELYNEVDTLAERLLQILTLAEDERIHSLMMYAESSICSLKDDSFYMLHELQKDLGYTDDATLLHSELQNRFEDIHQVLEQAIKKKNKDVLEYIYKESDALLVSAGTNHFQWVSESLSKSKVKTKKVTKKKTNLKKKKIKEETKIF